MHVTITPGQSYASDLIGYTTGLLITLLLLALTLRAAKLPGTPLSNIFFAICGLLWSAGGLAHAILLALGLPEASRAVLITEAVRFSGVGAFPIPVLTIWRPFAAGGWQRTTARVLQVTACISAACIAALLWAAALLALEPVPAGYVTRATAFNAAVLLMLGALVSLRRRSTPRSIYLPSLVLVSAIAAACGTVAIVRHSSILQPHLGGALGGHLVLLVIIAAFLLFARFRYADLFLRHGVRILLTGAWAGLIALTTQSLFLFHLASRSHSPAAVHIFLIVVLTNFLLLSFTFVDEWISRHLNRWLFRPPDYRAEARRLSLRLALLQGEEEVAAAVEESARGPLELSGARLVAIDDLKPAGWHADLLEGETIELRHRLPMYDAELLVPIASSGRTSHVLLVSPGAARPGLVTNDLNYLRIIGALCGNRLDALHREREAIERQSRESVLLQQVTEAELRALRAQVNPHFLFNCLNTIADLIVRNPAGAETMTLRLASVFRHVLAQSRRPLTSIREEIDFLRTYLHIEEARFGDRLQVAIEMDPAIAGEQVPSLILQPIVENALKHGLGPKPGPGHLWISAHAEDNQIRLTVEDDGMGLNGRSPSDQSEGLGLANVAERLSTLYQDRASVRLEPRAGSGSRVTVRIPRGEVMKAV